MRTNANRGGRGGQSDANCIFWEAFLKKGHQNFFGDLFLKKGNFVSFFVVWPSVAVSSSGCGRFKKKKPGHTELQSPSFCGRGNSWVQCAQVGRLDSHFRKNGRLETTCGRG